MGWVLLGVIVFLFVMVPLAEAERRWHESRSRMRAKEEQAMRELEKPQGVNLQKVPPAIRLSLMKQVLIQREQHDLLAELERMQSAMRRPWWKTWSLLPIVMFNGILEAGIVGTAIAHSSILFGAVASVGLLVVNIVMYFEAGCDRVWEYRWDRLQQWMPEGEWRTLQADNLLKLTRTKYD